MNPVGAIHKFLIHARRVEALKDQISPYLPHHGELLDVGSGDGFLASLLNAERPDLNISGIDVLLRPDAYIPVEKFDGLVIPYPDRSVDAVLIVDVLHHTIDPMVLLREARRVTRGSIILKDHLVHGIGSWMTLRAMDWVGNAHTGVALPYNYWSERQWRRAFAELSLTVDQWLSPLKLYPAPVDWVCGKHLHFIAVLIPDDMPSVATR